MVAVSRQQLWLTLRRARVDQVTDSRLWQSGWVRPLASRVVGRFSVVGSMGIMADGREQRRRGMLRLAQGRAVLASAADLRARQISWSAPHLGSVR